MWKTNAKQDGVKGQGPRALQSGKAPFPGVLPGSGGVSSQENPRRQRRQDYEPEPQPKAPSVKHV